MVPVAMIRENVAPLISMQPNEDQERIPPCSWCGPGFMSLLLVTSDAGPTGEG
jgi:hypothetical protein